MPNPHRLTNAQMQEHIKQGRSILINGQIISQAHQLPSDAELAATAEEEDLAIDQMEEEHEALKEKIQKLRARQDNRRKAERVAEEKAAKAAAQAETDKAAEEQKAAEEKAAAEQAEADKAAEEQAAAEKQTRHRR